LTRPPPGIDELQIRPPRSPTAQAAIRELIHNAEVAISTNDEGNGEPLDFCCGIETLLNVPL
jgi:hypothetical protein